MKHEVECSDGTAWVYKQQDRIFLRIEKIGGRHSTMLELTDEQAAEFGQWLRSRSGDYARRLRDGWLAADERRGDVYIRAERHWNPNEGWSKFKSVSILIPASAVDDFGRAVIEMSANPDRKTLVLGNGRVQLYESSSYAEAISWVREFRPEARYEWVEIWRDGRMVAALREE